MKSLTAIITVGLISTSLVSCATGLTNIRSNPEGATVYVVQRNNQKIKVGLTPINIPSQQLNPNNEKSIQIKVEKEGYKEESYFVPRLMLSSYIDLSVQLSKEAEAPSCEQQTANTEKVARNIAQSMFFMQQKKYQKAETILNELINANPDISTLYDLLGNVYYLNQKIDLALDSYNRSLEINPNSTETQRIVNKLRALRTPEGGR